MVSNNYNTADPNKAPHPNNKPSNGTFQTSTSLEKVGINNYRHTYHSNNNNINIVTRRLFDNSVLKILTSSFFLFIGVIYLFTEIFTFNSITSNVFNFLIYALILNSIIPNIIVNIIQGVNDKIMYYNLAPHIKLIVCLVVMYIYQYKLVKLYIIQNCAERKVSCVYYRDIEKRALLMTFYSVNFTFVLYLILNKLLSFLTSFNGRLHSVYNTMTELNDFFKYSILFGLCGTLTHLITLRIIRGSFNKLENENK